MQRNLRVYRPANSSLQNPFAITCVLLKTVVLFKEAINLAIFGLLVYLEHQHLWNWLWSKNGQKESAFFRRSSVYCSLNLRLFRLRNSQETEDVLLQDTSHSSLNFAHRQQKSILIHFHYLTSTDTSVLTWSLPELPQMTQSYPMDGFQYDTITMQCATLISPMIPKCRN